MKTNRSKTSTPHRIEVKVREKTQLFNSMDPSPFHEKDLDPDAEEFIESWAMEYPRKDPCSQKPKCVYHLTQHMVSQLRRTHN